MPRLGILGDGRRGWTSGATAAAVERWGVRKSLFVIAGLGFAGCVTLGLLMRQAVEMEMPRRDPPFLPALRARFDARLDRPLRLRGESSPEGERWLAIVHVADVEAAGDLVSEIGAEIWLHAARQGPVADVRVSVRVAGREPTTVVVPLPAPLR